MPRLIFLRALASHIAAFGAGMVATTAIVAHALPNARVPGHDAAVRVAEAGATFTNALAEISSRYIDQIDEPALVHEALRAVVGRLDTHSAFLPRAEYQRLRRDAQGDYGGVGIALGANPAGDSNPPAAVIIERVIPNSPAARAGIVPGDRVLAVDEAVWADTLSDRATTSRTSRQKPGGIALWDRLLRGQPGTSVRLLVARPAWVRPRAITLTREQLVASSVHSAILAPGVGYLAIAQFQRATVDEVRAALTRIDHRRGSALILDLRGNPGGLLDQAVGVADLFLEQGLIVTVQGRPGVIPEHHRAKKSGTWPDGRVLVLIDRDSASAAEIVAGALRDHGRAQILGETSYGKGSVQTFIDLDDGSGLKLTTARYLTPAGQSVESTGITPDIFVDRLGNQAFVSDPESVSSVPATKAGHRDVSLAPSAAYRRLGDEFFAKYSPMRRWIIGDPQLAAACRVVESWRRSGELGRARAFGSGEDP